jgi:hypothetical protein
MEFSAIMTKVRGRRRRYGKHPADNQSSQEYFVQNLHEKSSFEFASITLDGLNVLMFT